MNFFCFEIFTFFDPRESWVKSEKKSADLLKHEQLHFDIAELFARRLKKRLDKAPFTTDNYQRLTDDIFAEVLNEMDVIHNRYDHETRHGIELKIQHKWSTMIERKLGSSR